MRSYSLALLAVLLPCALAPVCAQESAAEALAAKRRGEEAARARLERLLAPVGVRVERETAAAGSGVYREVTVRLVGPTDEGGAGASGSGATLINSKVRTGALPRLRSLELSPAHLLVAAVSKDARLLWWAVVPDPRVLRAEEPGQEGLLTGRVVRLREAELTVNVPEEAAGGELRFYEARPSEGVYALAPAGAVAPRKE